MKGRRTSTFRISLCIARIFFKKTLFFEIIKAFRVFYQSRQTFEFNVAGSIALQDQALV
jgi:hypothetical protein